MKQATPTSKKSRILAVALAVSLAAAMAISGGTLSYLSDAPEEDVVNTFKPNYVDVDLEETTDNQYDIIPGTSQDKDPTVTVETTVDTYVFVTVKDTTSGLVEWEPDDGWTLFTSNEDDGTYVYYRVVEVTEDAEDNKYTFSVLKGDKVSYSPALKNEDMYGEDGELKEDLKLTFSAFAIQKDGFASAISAYYGYGVIVDGDTDLNQVLQTVEDDGSDAVTLKLSSDIGIDKTIAVSGMDVLIDLNGKTLTNSVTGARPFTISDGASVTVIGGDDVIRDETGGASYGVFSLMDNQNGSLTLEGGQYNLDTDNGAIIGLRTGSTADISLNDVEVRTNNRVLATVGSGNESSLTVNGGNYVTTNTTNIPAFYLAIHDAAFDGTTITTENVPCAEVVGSDVVFRNCTFNVKRENSNGSHLAAAVAVDNHGSATIDNGTYTAPYAAYVYSSGDSLTINGGTFTGTNAALKADKGKVVVNGGEFYGNIEIAKDATLTVYGGTFSDDPSQYVPEGYAATENDDETWTVKATK